MIITKIRIELSIEEKIFKKHKIQRKEIEQLFFNKPYYYKSRTNFVAIGNIGKFITIVFSYNNQQANIITAYKSSKWQRKLYMKEWNLD